MASLPETIIVGPFTYEVIRDPERWNEEQQDAAVMALTSSQRLKIFLKPGVVPSQAAVSLWHEVKHAIHDLTEHNEHSTFDEEEWIMKTAALEVMVLNDNVDLVDFLLEPE